MDEATKAPLISVLMSVFNGEKYLSAAVESILKQTLRDFEFIIVDDGSADDTARILSEYSNMDSRIRTVRNEKRVGLTISLNRGLDIARGTYIARMDADDISMPNRLESQIKYLTEHPEITAVFSTIDMFSEKGEERRWLEDRKNITVEQIRDTLPRTNCLAHPTLLIRAQVLKKYRYDSELRRSQDWDLWLRLISDDHKLAKINRDLLRHRVHSSSETQLSFSENGLKRKVFSCRNNFLKKRWAAGNWGEVEKQVLFYNTIYLADNFETSEIVELFPGCFCLPEREQNRELVIGLRKLNEGGVERVTAIWANEFNNRGYKVTLLTDDAPAPNDYSISASVSRTSIPKVKEYLNRFFEYVDGNSACTYIINDDYTEQCYKKMLILKILGKRVIAVNHGVWYVPAHPNARWFYAWECRPRVLGLMNAVVCLSLVDKAYWNWTGLKNAVYVPNPMPDPASDNQISGLEDSSIVWIGRFSEEKQPELMIDIFAQVLEKVPDATLCMVGRGFLQERCVEKAKKLGISNAIYFPGFVQDIGPYLRQSSVHCITSKYEGFPMSWLEAKTFGVPTVLFRLSNVEMSYLQGSISIEKKDKTAFVDAVVRLLKDSSARKAMGEMAFLSTREFAKERVFSRWELLLDVKSNGEMVSNDIFKESCPSERLSKILFEQTTQLLDDWMKYASTQKPGSEKSATQLTKDYLDAIYSKRSLLPGKVRKLIREKLKRGDN